MYGGLGTVTPPCGAYTATCVTRRSCGRSCRSDRDYSTAGSRTHERHSFLATQCVLIQITRANIHRHTPYASAKLRMKSTGVSANLDSPPHVRSIVNHAVGHTDLVFLLNEDLPATLMDTALSDNQRTGHQIPEPLIPPKIS